MALTVTGRVSERNYQYGGDTPAVERAHRLSDPVYDALRAVVEECATTVEGQGGFPSAREAADAIRARFGL